MLLSLLIGSGFGVFCAALLWLLPDGPDRDRLEAATEQAIAACGGDARDAVKALIVANEFLEAQVAELKADVSSGYARGYYHGRFKTDTG